MKPTILVTGGASRTGEHDGTVRMKPNLRIPLVGADT